MNSKIEMGMDEATYSKVLDALFESSVMAEQECIEAKEIGDEMLIRIRTAHRDQVKEAISLLHRRIWIGFETPKAKAATA